MTVGGLYWHEERDLDDHNSITACLPITTDFSGNFVRDVPGVCDGTAAPGSLVSVASWQEYVRQDLRPDVPGFKGAVWETDTEHMSAYLSVDWSVTDDHLAHPRGSLHLRDVRDPAAQPGLLRGAGLHGAGRLARGAPGLRGGQPRRGRQLRGLGERAHQGEPGAGSQRAGDPQSLRPRHAAGLGADQRRGDLAVPHAEGHRGVAGRRRGARLLLLGQGPEAGRHQPARGRRLGHGDRERALQVRKR